jgi:transposase
VERREAEAIYEQGRDAVVSVLLALSEQNDRLRVQVETLSARVARQDERIAELERRLNRSSRNSSSPPSVDRPGIAPKRGKDSSGRSQGAQSGHEGKGRQLLPAWAVDEIVEHWPDRCACGHAFAEEERVAVGEPVRWQVEELPVISVRVTEHRCGRVRCPGCGEQTRAMLPAEVAKSAFGPRCRRPSRRCRCATASLAGMWSSFVSSCSPQGSARARWTRSSLAPAMPSPIRMPICSRSFAQPAR